MPDRWERISKLVCAALAVMLVFQLGRMMFRPNPLSHLTIPALPTLSAETNSAPAMPANLAPPGMAKAGTNPARIGTNAIAMGTNLPSGKSTNAGPAIAAKKGTNTTPVLVEDDNPTNTIVSAKKSGTNATNVVGSSISNKTNVNAKGPAIANKRSPGGAPPPMAMMMGGPGMSQAPELPLPIQARVFRITDSEILGPVMRPLPTALLGIVGEVAFIRAASGQSGVIKEGENLGALKLLKIGTNRVLVEEEGQQKELMIFSGYGGDTLMPKQKDTSK